jgi:hypothetical protein
MTTLRRKPKLHKGPKQPTNTKPGCARCAEPEVGVIALFNSDEFRHYERDRNRRWEAEKAQRW